MRYAYINYWSQRVGCDALRIRYNHFVILRSVVGIRCDSLEQVEGDHGVHSSEYTQGEAEKNYHIPHQSNSSRDRKVEPVCVADSL